MASVDVPVGLLGYGTVVLRGTGMGIEKLGAIADPIALRKAVTT